MNQPLRVGVSLGLLALAGAIAWGVLSARREGAERADAFVQTVSGLAQAAPTAALAGLRGTAEDFGSADYAEVKDWLARVRSAFPGVRFLYILRQREDGTVVFLADSEPTGSAEESPPGQTFDEAASMPVLLRSFASGSPAFEGVSEDRWGWWASAYAPLDDRNLLGIDIDAGSWARRTASQGAVAGAAALLVLGIPAACVTLWLVQRQRVRERLADADRVRRLALVVQSTRSGVILADATGRAVEVNASLLALLGRTESDVVGQPWVPSVQHPDSPPDTFARIYEALRNHGGCDVETLARRRDGREFWCRIEVRQIDSTEGGHVALLTDIDASRRAEESLKAERRLLASILAAAPVGVLAFDGISGPNGRIHDFRIRLANPLAGRIAGTTIGALEGNLVSDLFPGFFSSGFFQRLCSCVEEDTPVQMELPHHRADGIAWLHGTAVPLGRGCVLCLADISAVKRTEEKFRAIFEQSTLACALIDATGITECNESFLRLFHLNHVREAVSRHPWSFCPERQKDGADSADTYSGLREQAFRSGHAIHTWRQLRTDGTTFEARLSLTPVTFGGRSVLLAFWVDLTAEIEARRQADENEERLHLAVESAEVLVWEWDSTRGVLHIPAGRPEAVHLTLENIRSAVRGWEAAWRAADSAAGGNTQAAVHESEHELLMAGESGRWLLLRGRATAWDDAGRAVRMGGTLTDITARRNAEDELRHARDRAEEGDRAKSRFLAMMSHEIRTPMNGVIGLLELLAGTPLNEEQEEYVQTILASAGTLMTVLNDVLDFSRIASDQLRLESVEFDVRRAFEDTLALHGEAAASRGLELWLDVAADVPESLSGDVTRIRQVVGNLVANAVKFTQEGGVDIAVRGRPLPDKAYELAVRVRDTGIGIAPDRQLQLFQPFVQADESMTRRFGGTGLGLAISRRLVQMMRGSIAVESQPGRGSTFRFHITLTESANGTREPSRALAGRTWALVTSNEHAGSALGSIFEREGGRLVVTRDGIPPGVQGVLVDLPPRGEPPAPPDTDLPVVRIQYGRTGGPGSIAKPVRARHVVAAVTSRGVGLRSAAQPAQRSLAGKRVLVAEDDDACLRFAEITLRRLGAHVTGVRDGRAAVDAFAADRPGIVLLDAHMPVLDGPGAAREIRAIEAASPSPHGPALLIALTGDTAPEDRDRILAAGVDAHLVKPISPAQITEALLERGSVKDS